MAALTIITTADHSPEIMQGFAEKLSSQPWDASMDLNWLVVDGLHAYQYAPTHIINKKNFTTTWIKPEAPLPQLAAIMLGLTHTQGATMVMDPDMAENLSDIPRFLAAHNAGAQIVFGWRSRRIGLSRSRVLLTRLFNRFVRLVLRLPLHDFNSPMISLSEKGLECLLACPRDCPSPRLHACYQLKKYLREVPITTNEGTKKSAYNISSRLKTGIERLREVARFSLYLNRKNLRQSKKLVIK